MKNLKKMKLKKISIVFFLIVFVLSDVEAMTAMAGKTDAGTVAEYVEEQQEEIGKEIEDDTDQNQEDTNKDSEKPDEKKDEEADNDNTGKDDEEQEDQDGTNKDEIKEGEADKENNQEDTDKENTDKENNQEDTGKENTDKKNNREAADQDDTDKENNQEKTDKDGKKNPDNDDKRSEDKKAGIKKALLEASAINISVTPTENGEGMTDIVLTESSLGGKETDIPVYCVRKGTDEGRHYALFFAGEGFSADEQDNFIYDVKEKTELFLKTAPMSYFAEKFDVYAALVPSEGSGKYVEGSNETFFRIKNVNSINKTTVFQKIRNTLASKLGIHKDNDVYTTVLVTNWSLGGGMSQNFHSLVSKGGPEVFIHETGHAANDLTDEYYMGNKTSNGTKKKANRIHISDIAKDGLSAEEIAALTMYDFDKLDITKVRWNAYLGFRGVYVDGFDDTSDGHSNKEFRPNHKQSMMGAAGEPFCPVCEAEIFTQLNVHFGNPYKIFIPQPEFSCKNVEEPLYFCNKPSSNKYNKPDINYIPSSGFGEPEAEFNRFDTLSNLNEAGLNTDCAKAAANDITFRTVVVPYSSSSITLRIKVYGENDVIRKIVEQTFELNSVYKDGFASSSAKSLEVVLPQKAWSEITEGHTVPLEKFSIVGEVIDSSSKELLISTDILKQGTEAKAKVIALYGDKTTKTDKILDNYSTTEVNVDLSKEFTFEAPEVEGYTNTNKGEIKLSYNSTAKNYEIKCYYTKDTGTVTQVLLDSSGKELDRKSTDISCGTTFIPKATDFPALTGYTLKLPKQETYDGLSNGFTLTYQYISEDGKDDGSDSGKDDGSDSGKGDEDENSTSIALDITDIQFSSIGESKTIKAKVTPSDSKVSWSSSDKSVADVSNGKVTAKGYGKAVITAQANGKKAKCNVTVSQKSSKPDIIYSKEIITNKTLSITKGKSYTLKATGVSGNNKITWSASNKKIATVSSSGKVKAVKEGTVTITAKTTDGVKASVKFKVINKAVKVSKLSIKASSKKVVIGQKATLRVSISPVTAANKKVTWKSSNTKAAKVSSKGVVTAVGIGKAKITVTAIDGSKKKASVTIKVTKPPKTSITKIEGAKNSAKLTWKKVKNISGYEVLMSAKKSSGYKVVKRINKQSTTSYTKKKLNSEKKYYFKVRAFKRIGKKRFYSSYSAVKSVTVK